MTNESSSRKSSRAAGSAKSETGEGFEARLDRLRKIVDELESGEMPLEKAIERYEEGVSVLKSCAETLSKARLRVDELSKDADEALGLRRAGDLEADAAGGAGDDDAGDDDE